MLSQQRERERVTITTVGYHTEVLRNVTNWEVQQGREQGGEAKVGMSMQSASPSGALSRQRPRMEEDRKQRNGSLCCEMMFHQI